MKVNLTPTDFINFEKDIEKSFNNKEILAPVHADQGNENQLYEVFSKYVDEEDWVCGTWRMHGKCFFKNVPPEKLKEAIVNGKSISLCFSEYRVISSAIVGGIFPIALGIAVGIKLRNENHKVVCFAGDMGSETGIFHECVKYATNHKLPIVFVIEDNNKSVVTNTREVWGSTKTSYEPDNYLDGTVIKVLDNVIYYKYTTVLPHAGFGQRIQF